MPRYIVATLDELPPGTRKIVEIAGRSIGVFNIGGGNRTSLRCALERLAALAGRPLDVRYGERESGDVRDTGADTERARTELGFDPTTTLEHGLAAELDWVRQRAEPAPPRIRTLTAS